jgi:hypothetical protein
LGILKKKIKAQSKFNFHWNFSNDNITLLAIINQASANIFKEVGSGANTIVCSIEISTILEKIETFESAPNNKEVIGSLNGKYLIQVDPYLRASELYLFNDKLTNNLALIKIKDIPVLNIKTIENENEN